MQEEILFENQFQVTEEKYIQWGKEGAFSGKRLCFVIAYTIFAVLFCFFGFFSKEAWFSFLFAVLSVYQGYFRWFIITKRQYRMLSQQFGSSNWKRRILFREDKIQIIDENMSIEFQYGDIQKIQEKGNQIKLMMKNKKAIRLYEDAFINHDWEKCKEFCMKKIE